MYMNAHILNYCFVSHIKYVLIMLSSLALSRTTDLPTVFFFVTCIYVYSLQWILNETNRWIDVQPLDV